MVNCNFSWLAVKKSKRFYWLVTNMPYSSSSVCVVWERSDSTICLFIRWQSMGTKTKPKSFQAHVMGWLTQMLVRSPGRCLGFLLRCSGGLLVKSEKLVGIRHGRRWVSSHNTWISILRTLEVFDAFFTRYLERNSPKLYFWVMHLSLCHVFAYV